MVNTRRSESCSVAPENGQRCQTDAERSELRELGSSCDSVNGEQEEDSEVVEEAEDSWSSPDKPLLARVRRTAAPPILKRPRELKARFVNGVHSRNGRRNARRRHVIYSTARHKMRDIMDDSDLEDRYSSSRRRNIERRAALSLRPITQKSYKDADSTMNCNSEDSADLQRTRRSRRSSRRNHYNNQSWIGDDYSRLNYSDDDSREAVRSSARKSLKNKSSYHFFQEHSTKKRSADRAESQDKENKEDSANRSTTLSSRPRRCVPNKGYKENDDTEDTEVAETTLNETVIEANAGTSEKTEGGDEDNENKEDEDVEEEEEEKDDKKVSSSESEEGEVRRGPRLRKRKRKISSSSSEGVKKSYSLRERRAKPPIYSEHLQRLPTTRNRNMPRFNGRRFSRRTVSSDSDSSSDSDRRHQSKYSKTPKSPHSKNDQLRTGAGNIQPIAPETIDPKINFDSVGGLKEHVQCLKEMVLLPMMYPEVFARFQIQPSRGVLFHGPPGTGKTLLARALANECSFGSKKVSFFMRKGADLLSKWIGESEKQLRVLFEQAAEKKPSIIFFDELDGLAPVRSGRQDQVHASIVSTLLALMDGLTNRGEIIVIGATNRIDAIDPALRRPGRFDRELFFPLPAQKEREEILKVHLLQWTSPPSETLISYLAESSVGYCGSDLKALCSEAVIQSFRRTYPQVYTADARLLLDPDVVKVLKVDFLRAKSVLVPASQRVAASVGNKLNSIVQPLLDEPLKDIMNLLKSTFPHGANPNLAKVKISANVRAAQMLVAADGPEFGNSTYLAPALLHHMEHIQAFVLDLASLHREGGRTPEEACIQIFHEAKRNVPSIIYIPNIDTLWALVSDTVIGIFETQLKQIPPNNPILLLATCDTRFNHLPDKLQNIFSTYRNEVYEMNLPDDASRTEFFKPLIMEATQRAPRIDRSNVTVYPELPRAPTPEPEPLSEEAAKKIYNNEEATLRELRIFLRDVCKKLSNIRLFAPFTKPVDIEEVPDYPTIIKEPMDLETMMTKLDFHRYQCAKDFLDDIELICRNALEYNPARTSADRLIRHRACSLRDYAHALIKSDMDSDFEDKCKEIAQRRQKHKASIVQDLPAYLNTPLDNPIVTKEADETIVKAEPPVEQNGIENATPAIRSSPSRKRKTSLWRRGHLKKRKRSGNKNTSNNDSLPQEKNSSCEEDTKESETIEQDGEEGKDDKSLKDNKDSPQENDGNEDKMEEDVVAQNASVVHCDINDLLSPSELLEDPLDFDDIDKALNESNAGQPEKVIIKEKHLHKVLRVATSVTRGKPLSLILDLHFQLSRIVKNYIKSVERTQLPLELMRELGRFKESHQKFETTHDENPPRAESSASNVSLFSGTDAALEK